MNYIFYIAIALLPSIIWLSYYLHKDKHPEPRIMVLKIFIWGMLVAFPAVIVEAIAIEVLLPLISVPEIVLDSIKYLAVVATTEEISKYLVVKFRVIDITRQLDEPVDAMEYMIISALGFAAIENVMLLTPLFGDSFVPTLRLTFSRFIGATFIHVLASATIGYYLALSLYRPDKKASLLIHGFSIAILIHGFYNILVVSMQDYPYLLFPLALIISSSAYVISIFFKKVSKMKSITMPPN